MHEGPEPEPEPEQINLTRMYRGGEGRGEKTGGHIGTFMFSSMRILRRPISELVPPRVAFPRHMQHLPMRTLAGPDKYQSLFKT